MPRQLLGLGRRLGGDILDQQAQAQHRKRHGRQKLGGPERDADINRAVATPQRRAHVEGAQEMRPTAPDQQHHQ